MEREAASLTVAKPWESHRGVLISVVSVPPWSFSLGASMAEPFTRSPCSSTLAKKKRLLFNANDGCSATCWSMAHWAWSDRAALRRPPGSFWEMTR